MSLPRKIGSCSICKKRGYTEWHHIISQHHAMRTGQEELLDNPDNLIELCKNCHDQTTASMVRKRLLKEGKRVKKQPSRRTKSATPLQQIFQKQNGPSETRQQRNQRLREEAEKEKERVDNAIINLELRGVFWRNSPYNQLKHLLNYLNKVSSEDPLAEKWNSILKSNPGISSLYPKDHWLHDSEIFEKKLSTEFEKDGFCWTINGGAWRKEVSKERANFEVRLANVRMKERAALEELQHVAAASEESRRKKEELEKSVENLEGRGVYDSDSHVQEFGHLFQYLRQVSVFDEMAAKWVEIFSDSDFIGLTVLYPQDHWMHNSDDFVKKLSAEFEKDGFCWTPRGGAWKKNLTKKQADTEIRLANIRAEEKSLIIKEEERLEVERARMEEEENQQKCVDTLDSRGVYFSESPVTNSSNLISYLKGTSSESEIADKWAKYFEENPIIRLYPDDHWLHSEEQFDDEMSKQFEEDGFCWTDKGGIWKHNLSLEQAKAEVNLAEVKAKQKAILDQEQAKVDKIKKSG